MALFELSRTVALTPERAWGRMTDWPRHSAMPLTRVGVRPGTGAGVGAVVVARTGVGRFGFDDPMEIVVWRPPAPGVPGLCRLEKRGRVVRGWAELHVRPAGPAETSGPDGSYGVGGSLVRWREDIRCAGLPAAANSLLAAAGRPLFGRVLDALLAG
ncbi:SRPBCC family protein [Actinacidiphila acididurans]|uniref:SRPBCC family protein n=1 Tax=Actinacidiphila acididurans TaxID=2784346 RepID=A0ABS2TZD4_9ACTN|nr:SRPBCC family protein [Actinacidiphila acididurans]MBM9508701.1 SRPBCC family protein [Actinacidiphila acididurans]